MQSQSFRAVAIPGCTPVRSAARFRGLSSCRTVGCISDDLWRAFPAHQPVIAAIRRAKVLSQPNASLPQCIATLWRGLNLGNDLF